MEQRIALQDQLEHERTKAARGTVENALRRHNLLPAVFAMFKAMGETGMMGGSDNVSRWAADGSREGSGGSEGEREGEKGKGESEGRVITVVLHSPYLDVASSSINVIACNCCSPVPYP